MAGVLYRLGRLCATHRYVAAVTWIAIAIDASIVRCVLVPASMVLLGRANWWFPGWLGRAVPRIGIEGEGFFKDRPTQAPAGTSNPGR
jgi:uncharacterized membrane protein YdfJ with MMPL/SSD domain